MITIHQGLVAETLGEVDGVAMIDESGVVKQGDDSVGVAAQYCGSGGTIKLICLIASPGWPDLLLYQLTLRCNTRDGLKWKGGLRKIENRSLVISRVTVK